MTFTIQKKYLVGLGNWLNTLSLNGKQSRARTRFVNLIQDALNRLETDRKVVLEEYAEKEEGGDLKVVEDDKGNKNYVVPDDKKEAFQKELIELYDEDAELNGPEFGPQILIVKDIVLNYDKEIDPNLATAYDKWCEAFEKFPKIDVE